VAFGRLNGDVIDTILFEPSEIDTEDANGKLRTAEGIALNRLFVNETETDLVIEVKLKTPAGRAAIRFLSR